MRSAEHRKFPTHGYPHEPDKRGSRRTAAPQRDGSSRGQACSAALGEVAQQPVLGEELVPVGVPGVDLSAACPATHRRGQPNRSLTHIRCVTPASVRNRSGQAAVGRSCRPRTYRRPVNQPGVSDDPAGQAAGRRDTVRAADLPQRRAQGIVAARPLRHASSSRIRHHSSAPSTLMQFLSYRSVLSRLEHRQQSAVHPGGRMFQESGQRKPGSRPRRRSWRRSSARGRRVSSARHGAG